MSRGEIRRIDVELHADSTCKNDMVTFCCRAAIEQALQDTEYAEQVATAKLTLDCPGKDPVRGCQARVFGHLFDPQDVPVLYVDTTAQELMSDN